MIPRRRLIPVFVPHLGCPHDCVFCNQRRISGAQAPVTAENVAEILSGVTGTGYEVAFYGGSFTAIPDEEQEAMLKSVEPFRKAGVVSAVRCSTRPDCVNDKALERLKRYYVDTVELGIQSLDEEVLRLSGRGHTRAQAIDGMERVKSAGFSLIAQMMTGLPGDTAEKDYETAAEICSIRPDGVRIYPTVVIRDTKLYEDWQRGTYRPQSVEEAAEICACLLDRFEAADIPVIRCGLNPTESLSRTDAAAGAYHPAFGEVVQSLRYRKKAGLLLQNCRGEDVILEVGPGQRSAATGQKRGNLTYLTEKYGLNSIKIRETDIKSGEIRKAPLQTAEKSCIMNRS